MKAAIYSPYLDTLGGGERYMMTIAEVLNKAGLEVNVLLDNHLYSFGKDILQKDLADRFKLNLNAVQFIKAPVGEGSSFFQRLFFLKNFDLLFFLTDGSIFIPTAKRNFIHIQSPLAGQPAESIWGRFKLKFWNSIIFNSEFTKRFSEKSWQLSSSIIYPPVDTDKIKPLKKENYILSVGRFFGYLKDKKHEVMIDTFRKLYEGGKIKNWSLYLAGSAKEGDKPYLDKLRKKSKDIPINFYPNLGYDDLVKIYGQSSIYWHASGFEENDPTKMEHFGISTVEAMAGGCVPVVIGKGGQREIVEDGVSGFLWGSLDEFKEFTMKLTDDNDLRKTMSEKAVNRARVFSKGKFKDKIIALCNI